MIRSLCVLAAVSHASTAHADNELPTFRLDYSADASCPPATELAERLATRVGYAPVRDTGTDVLIVRIQPVDGLLQASLIWVDGAGTLVGERRVSAPIGGCEALIDALAMTLAVQLDGLRAEGAVEPDDAPAPDDAPEPDLPEPGRVAPPCPEPPAETPASGLTLERLSVRAAASTSIGISALPPLGLSIGVAIAWSHVSVALELGAALPIVPADLPSGHSLEATAYAASAVVCLPIRPFDACALGELGVLQGTMIDLAVPVPRFSLTAAAGVRLAIDYPIGAGLGFFAALDALVVPLRALVAVDQVPVWEAAPVAGRLSVGASFGARP